MPVMGTKETDCRGRKGANPCCATAKHLTKILACNNVRVSHHLADLSAPRAAVGKNQTVSVYWPPLVGDFRQCAGRNETGKLHKFEVLKSPRPQVVGNNIEKTVSNKGCWRTTLGQRCHLSCGPPTQSRQHPGDCH